MLLKKYYKILIIIIIIIILGITSVIYNYSNAVIEDTLIEEYLEDTTMLTNSTTKKKTTKHTIKNTIIRSTTKVNYLMILHIPKINIKKGIYNKNDKNNNVDKNIQILDSSSMPDEDKGNVILASHNGNTKVSYFKDLEKLDINDLSYIYYKGIKYTYKVYKKEIVDKVGSINISKDKNSSNLILISCKNGTNDKQIVYVLKQINKEYY